MAVLFRVETAPEIHLGRPSLSRLVAFETGYESFAGTGSFAGFRYYDFLRNWLVERYGPQSMAQGPIQILQRIANDDERAFHLFFRELAAAIAATGKPAPAPAAGQKLTPYPASAYLRSMAKRPALYFGRPTVSRLRAFLDGYCLAAEEAGHLECLDLDGFEHWVRKQLDLKGMFRWEEALIAVYDGDDAAAYNLGLRSLREYRETKGPITVWADAEE